MTHTFDLLPYRQGRPLACWLDATPDEVRLACLSCGWVGPVLDLPAETLQTMAGDLADDDLFEQAYAAWQIGHSDALVGDLLSTLDDPFRPNGLGDVATERVVAVV